MKKAYSVLILLILFFVSMEAQAQTVDYQYHRFTADTATNADTLTFTFPEEIPEFSRYQWLVDYTNLSGTTEGTGSLESASGRGASFFYGVQSIADVSADTVLTGQAYGLQQRLRIITSGTHSTEFVVYVVYKEE